MMMEKLNYWSVLFVCGMTLGLMAGGCGDIPVSRLYHWRNLKV